jgi:hypothetical protein
MNPNSKKVLDTIDGEEKVAIDAGLIVTKLNDIKEDGVVGTVNI